MIREGQSGGGGGKKEAGNPQSVPVKEIMGVEMSVFGFSVEVDVLVDEVHSQQKTLISENLIGTPNLLNSVVFR